MFFLHVGFENECSYLDFFGCVAIGVGIILNSVLSDSPERDYPEKRAEESLLTKDDSSETVQEPQESTEEILFKYVLTNKSMWLLSLTGMLQYFIRTAVTTWHILFLIETRGFSPLEAGACLFWFDIGGLIGGLIAGLTHYDLISHDGRSH